MSNFAVIVHSQKLSPRIDSWLNDYAAEKDIFTSPLGSKRLVVIGKEVRRSVSGTTFFRGNAVSPKSNSLVFGVHGWLAAPPQMRAEPGKSSGEYVCLDWSTGRLQLDHDVFGQVRVAHTNGRGMIAASDSLLLLMSLRKALGMRNHLNREVAIARTVKNTIAGQQISPETHVEGISYLPAGRGLKQKRAFLNWEVSGRPMAETLAEEAGGGYVETMRAAAAAIAGNLQGLASIPGWHPRLSLSGGQDSRVILAAANAAGLSDEITITTLPRRPATSADFDIVMALVERFGLELSPGAETLPVKNPDEPLTLWAASLMGLYDGFGPRMTNRNLAKTFVLHGVGAGIHKGGWGWKTVPELLESTTDPGLVRDALHGQLLKSISSVGGDAEARNASEMIYLGYRNGIHGSSGHLGVHMTGSAPLMQLPLAAAAHTQAGGVFAGSPAGMTDLTLLLAPDFATEPYEDSSRNIDSNCAVKDSRSWEDRSKHPGHSMSTAPQTTYRMGPQILH